MKKNKITLTRSLIPVVVLIILLTINVILFFDNTLGGPNQGALLIAAIVASWLAYMQGKSTNYIVRKIWFRVKSALTAIGILLLIGALAGTWLLCGVVPAFIYYGVGIIKPVFFLVTSVIVCGLVSLATGSSWSTVATIGIALNGIGAVMGVHPGLIAGAIISGAYFGDKISPLSDTTNLASAMTQTDLFVHIRYMLFTTVPAMILTLAIFMLIGINYNYQGVETNILEVKESIASVFNITPWLMIVPGVLIVLIISKVKALPAMGAGVVLGAVCALIFQKEFILNYIQQIGNNATGTLDVLFRSIFMNLSLKTNQDSINDLLQSGGMWGMKNTVLLIISAMVFSGAMEAAGFLERIAKSVIRFAKSTGSVVLTTVCTSIFFNITASDQYIAIVVPGRMFVELYKQKGLKSEVLSRALEDAGTQTSVLVPWNTCGATQSSVLGVPVLTYLPFCFFNILSPLFSVLWAFLNFKIRRTRLEKNNK